MADCKYELENYSGAVLDLIVLLGYQKSTKKWVISATDG